MFGIVGHIHFHPALIKYVTDYRIQVLLYIAVHSGVSVQQDGRASPFQYDKSLITVEAFHMNIRNQSVKFRFLSTLMVDTFSPSCLNITSGPIAQTLGLSGR